MSDAAPIETALLDADRQAHAARPVPDLLFRLGGLIVLGSLVLMVAGPWLTPFDVGRPSEDIMVPPPELAEVPRLLWQVLTGAPHEPVHWFGTDAAGLDIFSRVVAAPRADVAIAVGANVFSLIAGSLIGLFAGTVRPWLGALTMRISDLVQAFPVFITGMILVTLAGRSTGTIIVTLALLYTPIYVRLTRSEVLTQRGRGFVDAARALGRGGGWIALRHVLPNALAPALIQASVTVGFAILMTAGLSFVGAGVRPPTPEWGLMIAGRGGWDRAGGVVAVGVSGDRDLDHGVRLCGVRQRVGAAPCPLSRCWRCRGSRLGSAVFWRCRMSGSASCRGRWSGLRGIPGAASRRWGWRCWGWSGAPGRILGGSVALEGVDLLRLPEAERRARRGRQIGLIVQNPRGSLSPLHTVGGQIRSVLRAHLPISAAEAGVQAVGLLRGLGLNDPERRAQAYPHEISGGMAQRVLIAMAMGAGPRLLVADEPTSGLDVTIQAQFLDQLWRTSRRAGSAVLLMTQDLGIIANYCDRVLVLQEGRIVAAGGTPAFFAAPQDDYSRTLLSLAHAARPAGPAVVEPLLGVRGLSKHFVLRGSGKRLQAVDRVEFAIGRGETLGLVGESGSGKTTVGRCLLRLIEPDGGAVTFEGRDLLRASGGALRATRRRIQIVFQDPLDALDPRWTVAQILNEAMVRPDRERVRALLELVGLDPETERLRSRGLSAGAQQRVGIARAIAAEPALIVLDEPTSALTPLARVGIVALLRDLQARLGMSYLFISHDLNTVEQLSHRVAVMYLGQVVELGTREQVFSAPRHPYARALLAAHLAPDPRRRRVDRVPDAALEGEIPSPIDLPAGCYLAGRCPEVAPRCRVMPQPLYRFGDGGWVRCTPAAERAGVLALERV